MKLLFASPELTPYARTGGLGDVLAALPAAMRQRGHECAIALPFYRCVREHPDLGAGGTALRFPVTVGTRTSTAEVLEASLPSGVQLFLIRQDEHFDRSGLYGAEGNDYADNAERFLFFSKAVVELARRMRPSPEVLHAHDWQTAFVPAHVRHAGLPFGTVLTLHNIAYQGVFPSADFALTNLPYDKFTPAGFEFYGKLNLLKGGIAYADALTTVSDAYRREILTPEGGAGLDAALRHRQTTLSGVLNGADYDLWDPALDRTLPRRYSPVAPGGKKQCRKALLASLGLDPQPSGPVYIMVTRLDEQKGLDLLIPAMDRLLADDTRLVVLGEGNPTYEASLETAVRRHRGRFAYGRKPGESLRRLTLAGGDVALMPSRSEPCGLTALYSLRYGAVPVAHAVGGLHQILRDFEADTEAGWAFLFYDYSPEAMWDALRRARRAFRDDKAWRSIVRAAMEQDFSWAKAAAEYERIYAGVRVPR